jgi:hypothetical protein
VSTQPAKVEVELVMGGKLFAPCGPYGDASGLSETQHLHLLQLCAHERALYLTLRSPRSFSRSSVVHFVLYVVVRRVIPDLVICSLAAELLHDGHLWCTEWS